MNREFNKWRVESGKLRVIFSQLCALLRSVLFPQLSTLNSQLSTLKALNFQLSILLLFVVSCSRTELEPLPEVMQQGEVLSFGVKSGGEAELSEGDYGLFAIEYAYGDASISWNPVSATLYLDNEIATLTNNTLDFGSACRYPISDSLSVFLYYPHNAAATPVAIPVDRTVTTDSNDEPADKYPDYLGGTKNISVIGGTPERSSDATVEMSHLMSRIRFQAKNLGADEIVFTSVKLTGIKWKGIINPQKTDANGYYTPDGGSSSETITLMDNFTLTDAVLGRPVPIYPKYNYFDDEAAEGAVYDDEFKYYMLVPPLYEAALGDAKIEIEYVRYGATYTYVIEMRQGRINQWQPGTSYCYTITFNTYTIELIDALIEPWREELFIGNVNINDLP